MFYDTNCIISNKTDNHPGKGGEEAAAACQPYPHIFL